MFAEEMKNCAVGWDCSVGFSREKDCKKEMGEVGGVSLRDMLSNDFFWGTF